MRRCLFVLSADFGEYVTARVFTRGQPLESHFALPARLSRYAADGEKGIATYENIDDLRAIVERVRPELTVLCSGYLFAVNALLSPETLTGWVRELKRQGVALATTDPWLRVRAMKPGARLVIHSVKKGGVDPVLTEKMARLQAGLEALFEDVPHLFAVPLPAVRDTWFSFHNPGFAGGGAPAAAGDAGSGVDEWLFILSREDYVFLAGLEGGTFFRALEERLREITSDPGNRVTVIAPRELEVFFRKRMAGCPGLVHLPFCGFTAFESLVRRAKIVAYWNVLSASLFYCLYHRVPPVFFGRGHQARVCEGLFDHVAEHVYGGRPPRLLELGEPVGTRAEALIEREAIREWIETVRRHHARSPMPAAVVERIIQKHAI
jgi:hypothetical protein